MKTAIPKLIPASNKTNHEKIVQNIRRLTIFNCLGILRDILKIVNYSSSITVTLILLQICAITCVQQVIHLSETVFLDLLNIEDTLKTYFILLYGIFFILFLPDVKTYFLSLNMFLKSLIMSYIIVV